MLELTSNVRFPPNPSIHWADRIGDSGVRRSGYVLVDTDNDRVPDTYLPGTSNFGAGWLAKPREPLSREKALEEGCHWTESGLEAHCPGPTTQ